MKLPFKKKKNKLLCSHCQLKPFVVSIVDLYQQHFLCRHCYQDIRGVKQKIREDHEMRRLSVNSIKAYDPKDFLENV